LPPFMGTDPQSKPCKACWTAHGTDFEGYGEHGDEYAGQVLGTGPGTGPN